MKAKGQAGKRYGHTYRAKPQADEHGQYDSIAEQERYHELLMLQKGNPLSALTLHPGKVVLIEKTKDAPEIAFRPDYSYMEDGRLVYEDCKPRPMNARENLIFKLWRHFGPGPIRITKRNSKKKWYIDKTIRGMKFTSETVGE